MYRCPLRPLVLKCRNSVTGNAGDTTVTCYHTALVILSVQPINLLFSFKERQKKGNTNLTAGRLLLFFFGEGSVSEILLVHDI